MVAKRQCTFCAAEIEPGTGTMFVKRDGTVFQFCSSSCRKQQLHLGRLGHRLKWTRAYALKKVAARSSAARAAPATAPAAPAAPPAPAAGATAATAAKEPAKKPRARATGPPATKGEKRPAAARRPPAKPEKAAAPASAPGAEAARDDA